VFWGGFWGALVFMVFLFVFGVLLVGSGGRFCFLFSVCLVFGVLGWGELFICLVFV